MAAAPQQVNVVVFYCSLILRDKGFESIHCSTSVCSSHSSEKRVSQPGQRRVKGQALYWDDADHHMP